MILSELAGVRIFGTGGLGVFAQARLKFLMSNNATGGVHRGGENSMDISGRQQIDQYAISIDNH